MEIELQKELLGKHAADQVQEGCLLGIGTGSTVHYFIKALAKRVRQGLSVRCVSSSYDSQDLGESLGIPFIEINEVDHLDITVDGADEITPNNDMIKGGGGALFREKLLAIHSEKVVILVDTTKLVESLGKRVLPVEILPFFASATVKKLQSLGFSGTLRGAPEALFVSDNGNLIYDIGLPSPVEDAALLHTQLIEIPGVLETGLFFDLPVTVLSVDESGELKTR